jgi:hypothetical protein
LPQAFHGSNARRFSPPSGGKPLAAAPPARR